MNINSTQIKIRSILSTDLQNVHDLHLLPETDQFNTLGIPENIEATKVVFESWFAGIENGTKHVFYIENSAGNFVGICGINLGKPEYFKGEIWYKILPVFWEKGIGTAVAQRMLQFGFEELNLHRIEAGCATDNIASVKVLEKNGFLKEGLSRKNLPIRGEWKDNFSFALLREDWKK